MVFLASLGAVVLFHFFPVHIVGELAGVPAIAALFGALFQVARDSVAYERSVLLEEAKNRFTIGATSHMASIAFDKHVQFCEEYTRAVNRALTTLFRRAVHVDILNDAARLSGLRTKWTLWLNPEMEAQLAKFEGALRTIGANAGLLDALRADADRTEAIKQAYGTLAAVMGFETWQGETVSSDLAAEKAIEGLRTILGISELTQLRAALVKRAMDNLKQQTS